jgi:hypothetical protein
MGYHAWLRAALACACAALGACDAATTPKTPPVVPGELIGRVEISEDVPISTCRALLEGTPLGGLCDETGEFDIKRVPPGRWNLRIISDGADDALPTRRIAAGVNASQVTDLGPVRLSKPGSIGGRLRSIAGHDLAQAILTIPGLGAVTAPSASGGYLLEGVSPGLHDVVLLLAEGQAIHANVNVQPTKVTTGVDFDLGDAVPTQLGVHGVAARAGAPGGQSGITVDLVESLDGKVVTSAVSDANGAFTLTAQQGIYLVRAHDAQNPATAIIPSVVVRGTADIELATALVVPATNGDLDGDGLPDAVDPDIDGDGVPNSDDAFPYDPAEVKDTDGDGVGDRADLRSQGGTSIDRQSQTPDTDGDGRFDFEDNCVSTPNPDQADTDLDGVGDACDNCPYVSNPDQRDSLGNGTGDACRTCHFNTDCPGGLLCQNGLCLECLNNRQCGDEVCNTTTHKCVACQSTSECSQPDKCDVKIGRCVACLTGTDCGANMTCTFGQCFPQCVSDASCPGQFCVNGACVGCRSNQDCPSMQWCDGGACRAQCIITADCTDGRTCDTMTGTCVLPCNGLCLNGQTCDNSVCRDVCDGSRPCGTGSKCAGGACVPECAIDGDCLGIRPFTICQAGQCVPNGTCVLDTDCDRSKMCVTGVCVARPTTAVANKGYLCNDPCQCRLDEACLPNMDGMSYCAVERAPTWFVGEPGAAECSGGGDGKTPATCATDLVATMAGAKDGDLIAAKAPTSANIFGGPSTAYSIVFPAPNVNLTGGYKVCGPNRWVRDPSALSIVHSSTAPVISVPGNSGTPLDGVTLRNFQIKAPPTGNDFIIINATNAARLTLSKLTLNMVSNVNLYFISCDTCTQLTMSQIDIPGWSYQNNIRIATLNKISGTIDQLHVGAFSNLNSFKGITVTNTLGPLSITNSAFDGIHQLNAFWAISVDTALAGPVTISNNQISPGLEVANSAFTFYGIALKHVPSFTVNNNSINGLGLTDPQGSSETRLYYHFEDSNGTASGNSVVFPTFTNIGRVIAYHVIGPAGGVTLDNNSASGGGGSGQIEHVRLESITSGTPVVSHGNFSQTVNGGSSDNYGLRVGSVSLTGFVVTDSTFRVGDSNMGTHRGGDVNASVGRIERSKFYMGTGSVEMAMDVTGSSQVELYDNYLYGGRATGGGNYSAGLQIETSSTVWAAGNTIDAGGVLADPLDTYGVNCLSSSTGYFTSNLISGGNGAVNHKMLTGDSTPCVAAGAAPNYKNNYFWYPASGGHSGGEQAGVIVNQPVGTPDSNGNVVNDNVGCYDTLNYSQPDYHIASSSPCVDKGANPPKRKDLSAITVDVDNNPRVGASDVGCSEAP